MQCFGLRKALSVAITALLLLDRTSVAVLPGLLSTLNKVIPWTHPKRPSYPGSFEVEHFNSLKAITLHFEASCDGAHDTDAALSSQVSYTFRLPYEREYLPDGLK